MARRKSEWQGVIKGSPYAADRAGRVVVPISLDNDPTRTVMIRVPLSKVPTLITQLRDAANGGKSIKASKRAARGVAA